MADLVTLDGHGDDVARRAQGLAEEDLHRVRGPAQNERAAVRRLGQHPGIPAARVHHVEIAEADRLDLIARGHVCDHAAVRRPTRIGFHAWTGHDRRHIAAFRRHDGQVARKASRVDARIVLMREGQKAPIRGPVEAGDVELALGEPSLFRSLVRVGLEGHHVQVAVLEVLVDEDDVPLLLLSLLLLFRLRIAHHEREARAVGGPGEVSDSRLDIGHLMGLAAGHGDGPDLIGSGTGGGEGDPLAVG